MTVTIGSQTNVPSPGSAILSPWAQDTARKICHQFASIAARDGWTSPPDGAICSTGTGAGVQLWQRRATAWVEIASMAAADAKVAKAGDTMSGNLVVGADPSTWYGAIVRADGVIASTLLGTSGGGPSTLTSSNLSLVRASPPASDVGGIFAQFRRSAGGIAAATTIGSITIATGGSAILYNTSSDRRLKTVHGPLDPADGLAAVEALQPVVFHWTGDDETTEVTGFLADEVQAVIPEAVTGDADAVLPADDPWDPGGIDPQQLDRSVLIPFLVAAVQALSARVAELEGAA